MIAAVNTKKEGPLKLKGLNEIWTPNHVRNYAENLV